MLIVPHIRKRSRKERVLYLGPERQDALSILDNLLGAQFRVAVHTVDKGDGYLANGVPHRLGCYRQSHLHTETAHIGRLKELLEHRTLVEPETARQVAHARPQHGIGKDVGALAGELALEVPAVDAAAGLVARARHNVVVVFLLQRNHLRDELGVVAKVGVHDDDVVALGKLQAVDVGGAEPELARARLEDDVGSVGLDELLGDVLGAVGRAVVDDDELPIDVAVRTEPKLARGLHARIARGRRGTGTNVLFSKGALQQPCDDGQVLALVEGGQDHRVRVLGGGGLLAGRHGEVVLQETCM